MGTLEGTLIDVKHLTKLNMNVFYCGYVNTRGDGEYFIQKK